MHFGKMAKMFRKYDEFIIQMSLDVLMMLY